MFYGIEIHIVIKNLTSFDVSNNTALTILWYAGNQLTSLNVTNNTELKDLSCFDNRLTSLDVSDNTELRELYCRDNQFTAAGLNALFGTLRTNTEGGYRAIYIGFNPGADGCDKSIATDKGWEVED